MCGICDCEQASHGISNGRWSPIERRNLSDHFKSGSSAHLVKGEERLYRGSP
jgi:hypothetical protein